MHPFWQHLRSSDRPGSARRSAFRPLLEGLETRALPSTAPQITLPDAVTDQPLALTASFADPDSQNWSATVDYGDAAGPQPLPLNADNTFNLNHKYTGPGPFRVVVEVTDDSGLTGRAEMVLTPEDLAAFRLFDEAPGFLPPAPPLVIADAGPLLPTGPLHLPTAVRPDPFAAGVAVLMDTHDARLGPTEPAAETSGHDAPPEPRPAATPEQPPPDPHHDTNETPGVGQAANLPGRGRQAGSLPHEATEQPIHLGPRRQENGHQLLASGLCFHWNSANAIVLVLLIHWTGKRRTARPRFTWRRTAVRRPSFSQRAGPVARGSGHSRAPPTHTRNSTRQTAMSALFISHEANSPRSRYPSSMTGR